MRIPSLKSWIESLPEPVGWCLARFPYRWRPKFGKTYRLRQSEIDSFSNGSIEQKQQFILDRIRKIVKHAEANVPFYHDLYSREGFRPDQLQTFEDIRTIPVINKSMLQKFPLEERSCACPKQYTANTGGSSGAPLGFYILPSSMPHEWAHMHRIWETLEYRPFDLKACFGGRNYQARPVVYDALRHHYAINIYAPREEIVGDLSRLVRKRKIKYLHGYPSALYDFANYCQRIAPDLTSALRKTLRGAFLGSEYPVPNFRNRIEEVFGIKSVSWYGHTERAVLAYEADEPYLYEPFHTYGYAETVEDPVTGAQKLVGTSYYNLASPFIRYDTGDEIQPVAEEDGLLHSFRIEGGREGDFVLDRREARISLTGLVFGRHHRIFDMADHVQISQEKPGEACFWITPGESALQEEDLPDLFDLGDMDIGFTFRLIEKPILTSGGKVRLRINQDPSETN
jgi:phenylacetate-CoA ligase